MDIDLLLTAIKWTLIVFTAGFIGYFGKYLGKILIAKFHERKKIKNKSEDEIELEKERLKLEKKRLKLEKKKRKIKEED